MQGLVIYENVAAAIRAQEVVQRLARELRPDFELTHESWKYDLLLHEPFAQQAADAAIAADVIIVAANTTAPLPVHITAWFTEWLAAKSRSHASLIALFENELLTRDDAKPTESACDFLCRAAQTNGMDFFCNLQPRPGHDHDCATALSRQRLPAGGWSGARRFQPVSRRLSNL